MKFAIAFIVHMYQHSELNRLIYNKQHTYVNLILSGKIGTYPKMIFGTQHECFPSTQMEVVLIINKIMTISSSCVEK